MVEVAEESAKLSRIRFQEGVILASELIDAEARLTDALAGRTTARAENRIAIANLRRATGSNQF
jgi:outer membrane protein TolC